ncbi:hypothetical protein NC652_016894 [Populus alba x Populus x berolinensis]|nr:hypothetical protein NC652_016893 [Populus alba x Populus x berolinensis]KAJ6923398.1 hypothetical protein NC652_016894 [Populus alba x Populus x berolinensis]
MYIVELEIDLMVEPVLKREIMFFIEDVIFSKVE